MAYDLKFVASQFRWLHSQQLQHNFRLGFWTMNLLLKPRNMLNIVTGYFRGLWRTWAACFIKAARRRHCQRKLDRSLREAEDRLQDVLVNESGSTPSLGATIYASRFAANALKGLRQSDVCSSRPTQRLMPLLPHHKPAEPDFTAKHR
ncbi:cyclic nucleotide-gated ion channel 1-like [Humulus lupulus]|uniref:cyclic nucleotide-gated ion channel 1-like n=1 Tax=Humulus lupulus TaxID=3486 RepID=UPI002B404204|nr:cyclic nucleotide-gated ion channel 1-like [Humulus lupulus]